MYKAFKIRLLPTAKQAQILQEYCNISRFVYNWGLQKQNEYRDTNNKKILSLFSLRTELTKFSKLKENIWMQKYSYKYYAYTLHDLNDAFQRFLKNQSKYPQFKSKKKSKLSFGVSDGIYFKYDRDNDIFLGLKLFKLNSYIKFKCSKKYLNIIPNSSFELQKTLIKNGRIHYKYGKWYFSFALEYDNQILINKSKHSMGIDMGLKYLATVKTGNQIIKIKNINHSSKIKYLERNLKHFQRNLSRKLLVHSKKELLLFLIIQSYKKLNIQIRSMFIKPKIKYSKSYIKTLKKVQKLYRRLHNLRYDYIQRVTTKLIQMKPRSIVMETLNIQGMLKNKYLAYSILNVSWYLFKEILRWKCLKFNIRFLEVDQWFPSTKRCSRCGHKTIQGSNYSERKCPYCGLIIDRDINSAKNLASLG